MIEQHALAVEATELAERRRRATIRAKMWAAARIEMMALKDGEDIARNRQKEQAAAWAYYEEAGPEKDEDEVNVLYVAGKPKKLTWRTLVFDSEQFMDEVVDSVDIDKETGETIETKSLIPREGVLSWSGYPLRMPLYSAVKKGTDGSVAQPLKIVDDENGRVVYTGPTYDWKVWQSLMEEGNPCEDRDDVFEWNGRLVLQPFTTMNENGEDVYTVVEYESGRILYSGPDLEPEEEEEEEPAVLSPESSLNLSRDASLLLGMDDRRREAERSEAALSKDRMVQAKEAAQSHAGDFLAEGAEEMAAVEGEADRPSNYNPHEVGGQTWNGMDDPALWQAMLEESIPIGESNEMFRWRGMNVLQPRRDGEMQIVETDEGVNLNLQPQINKPCTFSHYVL